MSTIRYRYALNEHDELVRIDEADKAEKYHCLNCGDEMIPKLGQYRQFHYAHKCNYDYCGKETYLHKLAKRVLKERFDRDDSFEISFSHSVFCSRAADCQFYLKRDCHTQKDIRFDLKEYYDSCDEEQRVNGFISDLLLTNSKKPKQEPVLIEIQVSHKSSPEKINSGLRIIEIGVHSEDDIVSLQSGPISDHTNNPELANISFYGFKTTSKEPLSLRNIQRFYLYDCGKSFSTFNEKLPCQKVKEKNRQETVFEASIDNSNSDPILFYQFGYLAARYCGFNVRTCLFCKHFRDRFQFSNYAMYNYHQPFGVGPIFCSICQEHGTPAYPYYWTAMKCSHYCESNEIIENVIFRMPVYDYAL